MDALLLSYRGEPLREFALGDTPVEVGSGAGCDIVVHDAEVRERHLLVQRRAGTVVGIVLAAQPRASDQLVQLAIGVPMKLGKHYELVRVAEVATRPVQHRFATEPVGASPDLQLDLVLLVGRGADARRQTIGVRPLCVGSADDNDLVLEDRAVSARHCRIEPGSVDLVVRDLKSRNGTWIDGVRVMAGRVGAGSVVRVGRTDLMVVARGSSGDARAEGLVAASVEMLQVMGEVERIARLPWPALLEGESGVGKEGVARALHTRGLRASGPFVALNAGGLPRELVESELFGHERGAFTGAVAGHKGVFEQANGGTLFLDEIGELPGDMQARLLRVLETWEVRRVGAESVTRVDVRLVCATHRDLRKMVSMGEFRQDLYYRLARLVIRIPPLRDRPGDIGALASHFLREIEGEVGPRVLSEEATRVLRAHGWPGNARELRNVLSAAAVATPSRVIESQDVDAALERIAGARPKAPETIGRAVAAHRGNLAAAARALGIPRTTLRDRVRSSSLRAAVDAQRITKPA